MDESLLLDDFKDSTVSEIDADLSRIMSLATAFSILVSYENSNKSFDDLSPRLKEAVDEGIEVGIEEVEKVKTLLEDFLSEDLSTRDTIYLYELIRVFNFLSRAELVARSLLKDRLSDEDSLFLKNAINRLGELSYNLRELRRKKRIKNTELAEHRLDEVMRQMNDSIFDNWISTVNELERQEYYGS